MIVPYFDNPRGTTSLGVPNPQSLLVKESGKVRSSVLDAEGQLTLSVKHSPLSEAQMQEIRTWIKDNRNNRVLIDALDGTRYLCDWRTDGYTVELLSSTHYSMTLEFTATDNLAPMVVRELNVLYGDGSVTFSFVAPEIPDGDLLRYEWETHHGDDNWGNVQHTNVPSLQFLGADALHAHARVRTRDTKNRVSDWSADAVAIIHSVPTQVTGLGGTTFNDLELLQWNEKDNADGYIVEQIVGDGDDWQTVATVTSTTYTATLTRGARHRWRVTATNIAGRSIPSAVYTVNHPLVPPSAVGEVANPIVIPNPKSYRNVNVAPLLRKVGFGRDRGTYFRFRVPNNETEGFYRIIMGGSPTTSNWNISEADGDPLSEGPTINEELTFAVERGKNYDFVVYPGDVDATQTLETLTLTIITFVQDEPDAPVLSATDVTQLRIPFEWTLADHNNAAITNYQLNMSLNNQDWFTVFTDSTNRGYTVTEFRTASTAELQKVKPNTTYYFRVRAYNSIGWGDWSNVVVVRTPNFSVADGSWQIGRSGIDAGIITSYETYDPFARTSQIINIDHGRWLAQFTLSSFGGYQANQVHVNLGPSEVDYHERFIQSSVNTGFIDGHAIQLIPVSGESEGDIWFVLGLRTTATVDDPNPVINSISFAVENPSGKAVISS